MITPATDRFVVNVGGNNAVAWRKIIAVIIGDIDSASSRRESFELRNERNEAVGGEVDVARRFAGLVQHFREHQLHRLADGEQAQPVLK